MEKIEQQDRVVIGPRWMRALQMVLFMIAFGFGQTLLGIVAVVQFVWLLASGEPNNYLRQFGTSLARWFADVVRFLTCASDDKPFPWKAWPTAE